LDHFFDLSREESLGDRPGEGGDEPDSDGEYADADDPAERR
jgi:hypothetical protein